MSHKKHTNQVRIIAGEWRGRRLPVIEAPGLRPTGDRVRETLFNWLGPHVIGARCLDLFAGSGTLGLEALSRGASSVVFVEKSRVVLDGLIEATRAWPGINKAEFVCADAKRWLLAAQTKFDLVFLDPPFGTGWIGDWCHLLVERGLIRDGGQLYLESAKGQGLSAGALDPSLSVEREKVIGQVEISLVRYHSG